MTVINEKNRNDTQILYAEDSKDSSISVPSSTIMNDGREPEQATNAYPLKFTPPKASFRSSNSRDGNKNGRSNYQHPPRSSLPRFRPRASNISRNYTYNHNPSHSHHRNSNSRDNPCTSSYSSSSSSNKNNNVGFDSFYLVDRLCDPRANLFSVLDKARASSPHSFNSGKAITSILSQLARKRNLSVAMKVWEWMDNPPSNGNGTVQKIEKNVFHYNSLISVCEKMKDWKGALDLLYEMDRKNITKNEVTFSAAISACEKAKNYKAALALLDQMEHERIYRTAIAYNAAISACEKSLKSDKAIEVFERMKNHGVKPTIITYSALISACEKCGQWQMALKILDEMKHAGFGTNVIAYSAAISALSRGQQWEKALELFREIESGGQQPSVVTYNATMTALEKGLQWERALDLFDQMKQKQLPITVVSYGSAISACEKGYQWKQCLSYLDEMTERGIKKNVIIFGAAISCMEKSCRATIALQLMERMKLEGVTPNIHIYNSAISACARCNLWEKGHKLFLEMKASHVKRDIITYNAVLDAVCSNVPLARDLFLEGVEQGFYASVSKLTDNWLELDVHFLSLGGGEIALCWWFEECLVPYLKDSVKLSAVKSISIVSGYGKTRMRGARYGDDGMRKRIQAMLRFMNIKELKQPNKGRIQIDTTEFVKEVEHNNGRIIFDRVGYQAYKEEETTANAIPDVEQVRRQSSGMLGESALVPTSITLRWEPPPRSHKTQSKSGVGDLNEDFDKGRYYRETDKEQDLQSRDLHTKGRKRSNENTSESFEHHRFRKKNIRVYDNSPAPRFDRNAHDFDSAEDNSQNSDQKNNKGHYGIESTHALKKPRTLLAPIRGDYGLSSEPLQPSRSYESQKRGYKII